MKHTYKTTRAVDKTFTFVDAFNADVESHSTTIKSNAGSFVFRGSNKAFKAHLQALNKEYGTDYAIPYLT